MPIRNSDFKKHGRTIHTYPILWAAASAVSTAPHPSACGMITLSSCARKWKMRPFKTATDYDYSLRTIYLGVELSQTPTISSSTFSKVSRRLIFPSKPFGRRISKWKSRWNATPMMSREECKTLLQLPVNRVSMGAQSFLRPSPGLSSPPPQGCRCQGCHQKVTWHRHPQPTSASTWCSDFLAKLWKTGKKDIRWSHQTGGVEHISAYSLMYEEGTTLSQNAGTGERLRKSWNQPTDVWATHHPTLPLVTSITKSTALPTQATDHATTAAIGMKCPISE